MGERVPILVVTPDTVAGAGPAVRATGKRRPVPVRRHNLAEAAEELVEKLVDALRAKVPLRVLVARRL